MVKVGKILIKDPTSGQVVAEILDLDVTYQELIGLIKEGLIQSVKGALK